MPTTDTALSVDRRAVQNIVVTVHSGQYITCTWPPVGPQVAVRRVGLVQLDHLEQLLGAPELRLAVLQLDLRYERGVKTEERYERGGRITDIIITSAYNPRPEALRTSCIMPEP